MKKRNFHIMGQSIITKLIEKNKNINDIHLPILPKFHHLHNLNRKEEH